MKGLGQRKQAKKWAGGHAAVSLTTVTAVSRSLALSLAFTERGLETGYLHETVRSP